MGAELVQSHRLRPLALILHLSLWDILVRFFTGQVHNLERYRGTERKVDYLCAVMQTCSVDLTFRCIL